MRILAVDPGSTLIGWSVLQVEETLQLKEDGTEFIADSAKLLDHGLLEPFQSEKSSFNQQASSILWQAVGQFQWIIKSMSITHVAWEIVPAFGQYAHRDKIVAVINGLKTLTFIHDLSWCEQAPIGVKKAATGNAKADKKEMRVKALELYPEMKPFKTPAGDVAWDVYDSALIGWTAWQKNQWTQGEQVLNLVKAG